MSGPVPVIKFIIVKKINKVLDSRGHVLVGDIKAGNMKKNEAE